ERFLGQASSGHGIVLDGAQVKSGNSPMELVLVGLCGCTAIDVVSILRKKREPFTRVEVRAQAERAPEPPTVYTEIKLIYRVVGAGVLAVARLPSRYSLPHPLSPTEIHVGAGVLARAPLPSRCSLREPLSHFSGPQAPTRICSELFLLHRSQHRVLNLFRFGS